MNRIRNGRSVIVAMLAVMSACFAAAALAAAFGMNADEAKGLARAGFDAIKALIVFAEGQDMVDPQDEGEANPA